MPIPVDGVIPYTNYSIEKTPEKQDKSKRPSPPSQPTFVDDPLLDKFKRCPSVLLPPLLLLFCSFISSRHILRYQFIFY